MSALLKRNLIHTFSSRAQGRVTTAKVAVLPSIVLPYHWLHALQCRSWHRKKIIQVVMFRRMLSQKPPAAAKGWIWLMTLPMVHEQRAEGRETSRKYGYMRLEYLKEHCPSVVECFTPFEGCYADQSDDN